jgi:hypothetical protein
MKALRIFTRYSGNLPGFYEWEGRRLFASFGLCTFVPVGIGSMKDIALVQIVIDGQCWEGEVVYVAPADADNHALVGYRRAHPVAGNTERTPGPGYVRYVDLEKRGEALAGSAREEAEDALAAYALKEMTRAESLNRDGAAKSVIGAIDPEHARIQPPRSWRPLVIST